MLIKFAYKINNSPLVIIYMNPKKKKRHKKNPRKKENKRSKKNYDEKREGKREGGEIDEETNDFCNFGWATGAIAPPTFPPIGSLALLLRLCLALT